MSSLINAVYAVIPFLIYITLGIFLKKIYFKDNDFFNKLNKIVFKLLFPCTMFKNFYKKTLSYTYIDVIIIVVISLVSVIIILCFTAPHFIKKNSQKGVIIQALYRSNTLVFALPIMQNFFGDEGTIMASVVLGFTAPICNISSVIILEYYNHNQNNTISWRKLLLQILSNPIIVGIIFGISTSFLPFTFPDVILSVVSNLSSMSTPLALISLGGTLELYRLGKNLPVIIPVVIFKLIILPAIMLAILLHLHLSPIEFMAVFTIFITPVATSLYPMAQNMGGDSDLAGELVVTSTIFCILTLSIWLIILEQLNIL